VRLPGNGNGENGMIHPVHRTPFHAHHHRHARVDSPKCPLPRVVSPLTVSPMSHRVHCNNSKESHHLHCSSLGVGGVCVPGVPG
jgi:hypothetical protein